MYQIYSSVYYNENADQQTVYDLSMFIPEIIAIKIC